MFVYWYSTYTKTPIIIRHRTVPTTAIAAIIAPVVVGGPVVVDDHVVVGGPVVVGDPVVVGGPMVVGDRVLVEVVGGNVLVGGWQSNGTKRQRRQGSSATLLIKRKVLFELN